MAVVDARGRSCPEPVIMTKRALEKNGNTATVMVDSDICVDNITRFAESRDLKVSVRQDGEDFVIEISK